MIVTCKYDPLRRASQEDPRASRRGLRPLPLLAPAPRMRLAWLGRTEPDGGPADPREFLRSRAPVWLRVEHRHPTVLRHARLSVNLRSALTLIRYERRDSTPDRDTVARWLPLLQPVVAASVAAPRRGLPASATVMRVLEHRAAVPVLRPGFAGVTPAAPRPVRVPAMPAAVERGAATPAQVARTVPGGKAQEAFDPGPGWGGPAAPPAWNAPPAAPPPDMELIADHVLRLLDQRVIAERERFGRV